jgi:signal transduction histidine kinase
MSQRILHASSQLARLVADLTDFDRLERGQVAVRLGPVDLAPLLRDVVESFQDQPGGERLTSILPEQLPVHADAARVTQVASNLIENALKYAPDGPVVVRAEIYPGRIETIPGHHDRAAEGSLHPTDHLADVVRVAVEDEGPGVAPEDVPRVWEKFFRGQGVAGLNVSRGTGIGLAVVKALVEAHGGRVGLDAPRGGGARFWFELPAGVAEPSPAALPGDPQRDEHEPHAQPEASVAAARPPAA